MARVQRPLILLDVGGVLADVRRGFADPRFEAALFGEGRKPAFDVGKLDATTFFDAAAAALGDAAARPALVAAYESMFVPRAAALDAAVGLARTRPVGLFSDIDPIHFDVLTRHPSYAPVFAPLVVSFRTGVRKPTPAAFAAAERLAGCAPDALLLVDDRGRNREAAAARGWMIVEAAEERDVLCALAMLAA